MGAGKENPTRFNLHSNAKIFILYLFYPTLWLQTFLGEKKKNHWVSVWNNSLPRKALCRPPTLEDDFMLTVNSLSHLLNICMHNIFTFQIPLILQAPSKLGKKRSFEILLILIDFSLILETSWVVVRSQFLLLKTVDNRKLLLLWNFKIIPC